MTLFRRLLPLILLACGASSANAWDGVFIPAPDYASAGDVPSATLLSDDRVLVSSGEDISLLSPQGSNPTIVAHLPYFQRGTVWIPLPNGKVLGSGGMHLEHRAMLFDPATSAITTVDLLAQRFDPSVTALSDGRVMIAGGCTDVTCATPLASTEIYNPATGAFSPGPRMLERRMFHSATLLADGRVLMYGGRGYDANAADGRFLFPLKSAEIYDPSINSFVYTRDMNGNQTYMWLSRSYHSGTALANGTVLLCGGKIIGQQDYGGDDHCDVFVVATGKILSSAAASLGVGGMDHTATVLADGALLFTGGTGNLWPIPQASAAIYDPTTGITHAVSNLIHARRAAAAVRLRDGSVLMIGGQTPPMPPDPSLPFANYPWTPTMERYVPDVIFKDAFDH